MSDILREVDEAMRVERMQRLWEQHGKTIIFILAAIILGTAADAGWKGYKAHKAEKQTSALLNAVTGDDPAAGVAKLTTELHGSGLAFAALAAGKAAIEKQDYEAAIGFYQDALKDKSIQADLHDLIVVQLVSLELDHQEKTTGQELLDQLAPVLKSNQSAWYPRGLLLSAVIKAHKDKDYKGALEQLALMSAVPDLPASLQAQMDALKEVYTYNLQNVPANKE